MSRRDLGFIGLIVGCLLGCGAEGRARGPSAETAPLAVVAPEESAPRQRSAEELLQEAETLVREAEERVLEEHPTREEFSTTTYSGAVACDVVSPITLDEPLPFRLRRGAPPFALFYGHMLRFVVPVTPRAPEVAYVTADASGIVVHGAAEPRDLPLHPAFPMELDGIVIVTPEASIEFSGAATPGKLGIAYRPASDERLVVNSMTLQKRVGCSDVTLERRAFSAEVGLRRQATAAYALPPGAILARVPGGAPFARVPPYSDALGFVIGSTSKHFRVVVVRQMDAVVGWTAKFTPDPSDLGTLSTHNQGHRIGIGVGFGYDVATCPRVVPLSVEQGESIEWVGLARKDATLRLRAERESDFVVDFPGRDSFDVSDDASFLAKKADLEGCRIRHAD